MNIVFLTIHLTICNFEVKFYTELVKIKHLTALFFKLKFLVMNEDKSCQCGI